MAKFQCSRGHSFETDKMPTTTVGEGETALELPYCPVCHAQFISGLSTIEQVTFDVPEQQDIEEVIKASQEAEANAAVEATTDEELPNAPKET